MSRTFKRVGFERIFRLKGVCVHLLRVCAEHTRLHFKWVILHTHTEIKHSQLFITNKAYKNNWARNKKRHNYTVNSTLLRYNIKYYEKQHKKQHEGFTMTPKPPFSLSGNPSLMSARLVMLPPCVPLRALLYCSMLLLISC